MRSIVWGTLRGMGDPYEVGGIPFFTQLSDGSVVDDFGNIISPDGSTITEPDGTKYDVATGELIGQSGQAAQSPDIAAFAAAQQMFSSPGSVQATTDFGAGRATPVFPPVQPYQPTAPAANQPSQGFSLSKWLSQPVAKGWPSNGVLLLGLGVGTALFTSFSKGGRRR